jgi:hypothetical protein
MQLGVTHVAHADFEETPPLSTILVVYPTVQINIRLPVSRQYHERKEKVATFKLPFRPFCKPQALLYILNRFGRISAIKALCVSRDSSAD